MPIGGAEDKVAQRLVLNSFVRLAGGNSARLVVIPTASEIPDEVGAMYHGIFTMLGAAQVQVLDVRTREQAEDAGFSAALLDASGIFMTGGDQMRLATLFNGTWAVERIKERFDAGAVVAGTSAGASAMSRRMIASGLSGIVPSVSLVETSAGLGLIDRVVIDQHFRQRQRIGRLITVVLMHPELIGLGIDEDTALVIGPGSECEVVGSGSVTVVDGSHLQYTDIHQVPETQLASVLGVTVHMLTKGYRYHIETRTPLRSGG